MLVWWTNRSRLPSSGVMKPKPFSSLNHLTVPVATGSPLRSLKCYRGGVASPRACTCVFAEIPRGFGLSRGKVARHQAKSTPDRAASRAGYRSSSQRPMEDPIPIRPGVAIPLREVTVRASRSSGPGGQHANVTASRIEASFDVRASAALSDEQKERIIARLGPRVVAVAQDERSQSRNRELALERLAHRLSTALAPRRARRPTRPTASSVTRRLDAKRRQSQRKRDRRPPAAEQ